MAAIPLPGFPEITLPEDDDRAPVKPWGGKIRDSLVAVAEGLLSKLDAAAVDVAGGVASYSTTQAMNTRLDKVESALFLPTDLAGLFGWWDPSRLTGIADGATVATLPDLSGNGRALTQAVEAAKPIYRAGRQNGKSVLEFNGAQLMRTATWASALTQPFTLFVVAQATTGADRDILGGGDGQSRLYVRARTSGTFTVWGSNNPDGVATLLSTGANNGAAKLVTVVAKGGSTGGGNTSKLRVNGGENTTDAFGIGVPNALVIGSGWVNTGAPLFLTGQIMEVILYNRELSTTEINSVEAYLA